MNNPFLIKPKKFQSTLPRREWRYWGSRLNYSGLISIHTPAKGVTGYRLALKDIASFQSTLPRREWQLPTRTPTLRRQFQSTLPRREWPVRFSLVFIAIRFQSTLPRREWPILCFLAHHKSQNFNPHSREGSDKRISSSPKFLAYFNPHSREGSDHTAPAGLP